MVAFNLGGAASPSPKPKGGHGVFGFVKNLGTDVVKSVEGMPMGVVNLASHPVRSLEDIGKSTWHDWSPLFKGHPMTFLHQTYQHPLAPILDIVSVATAGAGSAGRVGSALADAGAISDTSKLARLGAGYRKLEEGVPHARVVEHTGRRGTMLEVYAANPVTRAIQKGARGVGSRVLPNFGGGKYDRLVKADEGLRGVAVGHANADVVAAMKDVFNTGKYLETNPKDAFRAIDLGMHENLTRMARHTTMDNIDVVRKGAQTTYHAPDGVAFIPKRASGMAPFGDMYTKPVTNAEQLDKALKNWGRRHTVRKGSPDELMLDSKGVPLVVPTHTVNLLLKEGVRSSKFVKWAYKNPTMFWKQITLTTPRFFTNNVFGNTAMAINKLNPYVFARGVIDAVRQVHGNRTALKMADTIDHVTQKAVGPMNDVVNKFYLGPHSEGFGYEAQQTPHLYQKLEKRGASPALVKALKAGETGLFDITHRIAEKGMRRAGIAGMLRQSPEVRALMKQGHSLEDASAIASRDPRFRAIMQHQMDNVLGQYHYYNGLEQHLRQIIPFYSWDRAIMRHAKSLALENPGRAAAEARLGQQGVDTTKKLLGAIPSFMENLIPLGGGKALSTQGFNPYQSVADTIEPALATVGLSNQSPGEALSMQLNPYLAGLMETITGQSLLSGKKLPPTHGGIVGGLLQNVIEGLPEKQLVQDLAEGTPKPKSGKPFLYSKDPVTQLLALAGVPIKKVNQQRAAELAKAEAHVVKHRKQAAKPFTL